MKKEASKQFKEKFQFCTEHRAIERVIPGLNEHVAALTQEILAFLEDVIDEAFQEGVRHGMATVRSNTHE